MTPFQMKVMDVFHFADGRTVLVGPIEGGEKFIRPCQCELLVDGVSRALIHVEGEMIADQVSTGKHRALSTWSAFALERRILSASECVLKSVARPASPNGSHCSVAAQPNSAAGATLR